MFPSSAYLSALCTNGGKINTIPIFLNTNTKEAIGNANVSAASGPLPFAIANAVPKTVPEIISGGILAPIENAPMNASSKVAPNITPVGISPITTPVNAPITIGLESKLVPNKYSALPSIATKPKRIACNIVYPPYKTFEISILSSFGTIRISTSIPF